MQFIFLYNVNNAENGNPGLSSPPSNEVGTPLDGTDILHSLDGPGHIIIIWDLEHDNASSLLYSSLSAVPYCLQAILRTQPGDLQSENGLSIKLITNSGPLFPISTQSIHELQGRWRTPFISLSWGIPRHLPRCPTTIDQQRPSNVPAMLQSPMWSNSTCLWEGY